MQPLLIPISDRLGTEIPLQGSDQTRFHSRAGSLLAKGYTRIVLGGRGAYVEFSPEQIQMAKLFIPEEQAWRSTGPKAYYVEYRSIDTSYVKVYHQRKVVDYADYKIGMFYIAPADLIISVL